MRNYTFKKGDYVRFKLSPDSSDWLLRVFDNTTGVVSMVYVYYGQVNSVDVPVLQCAGGTIVRVKPLVYDSSLEYTCAPGFLTIKDSYVELISEEEWEQERLAYLLQQ